MYKVRINGTSEFHIDGNKINGSEQTFDMCEVKKNTFHILQNAKSYNAVILQVDMQEKTMQIRVNNNEYSVKIQDKFDLLLQEMGMGNLKKSKVNHLKAPMPGLILRIEKQVGQEVQKGESILILEAMKMENVLKAPENGIIKSIQIESGQAVEKNQILVEFQ